MTSAAYIALVAYIAATAVGMLAGSFVPFWVSVAPLVMLSGVAAVIFAAVTNGPRARNRFYPALAGSIWGAIAGAFATSTCGPTHARSLLGSDVSAVVVGLVAVALAFVADMLPRPIATRPHALCGLLFLLMVVFALALGAEVPT